MKEIQSIVLNKKGTFSYRRRSYESAISECWVQSSFRREERIPIFFSTTISKEKMLIETDGRNPALIVEKWVWNSERILCKLVVFWYCWASYTCCKERNAYYRNCQAVSKILSWHLDRKAAGWFGEKCVSINVETSFVCTFWHFPATKIPM